MTLILVSGATRTVNRYAGRLALGGILTPQPGFTFPLDVLPARETLKLSKRRFYS